MPVVVVIAVLPLSIIFLVIAFATAPPTLKGFNSPPPKLVPDSIFLGLSWNNILLKVFLQLGKGANFLDIVWPNLSKSPVAVCFTTSPRPTKIEKKGANWNHGSLEPGPIVLVVTNSGSQPNIPESLPPSAHHLELLAS